MKNYQNVAMPAVAHAPAPGRPGRQNVPAVDLEDRECPKFIIPRDAFRQTQEWLMQRKDEAYIVRKAGGFNDRG